ncbi:MAG: hypothetical protein R3C68_15510 [Myxococcota bacterium]
MAFYDSGSATVFAGLQTNNKFSEKIVLNLDVGATEVLLDGFKAEFMREFMSRAELRFKTGVFEPGFYAEGGYRDFIDSSENERDGPRAGVGLVDRVRAGRFSAGIRAGVFGEFAEGETQQVDGIRATLGATYQPGDFRISAGVSYEYRRFKEIQSTDETQVAEPRRIDQRLTPGLSLAYNINDRFGLNARYSFVNNSSTSSFDYSRHLGQAGVEVRW